MKKKILILLGVMVFALQLPQAANAGPSVKTKFGGWYKKYQQSRILDRSKWFTCFSNRGGYCVSGKLTTGRSKCTGWAIGVGTKWKMPLYITSLDISVETTKSWKACNTRSESMTCQPYVGWKGRAAVVAGARWGILKVTGTKAYWYGNVNWDKALHACKVGYWRRYLKKVWRPVAGNVYYAYCDTVTDKVYGWLPEKRFGYCQYRKD